MSKPSWVSPRPNRRTLGGRSQRSPTRTRCAISHGPWLPDWQDVASCSSEPGRWIVRQRTRHNARAGQDRREVSMRRQRQGEGQLSCLCEGKSEYSEPSTWLCLVVGGGDTWVTLLPSWTLPKKILYTCDHMGGWLLYVILFLQLQIFYLMTKTWQQHFNYTLVIQLHYFNFQLHTEITNLLPS